MSTMPDAVPFFGAQTGDVPAFSRTPAVPPMTALLWDGWKSYTRRAAAYQSIVLLSLIYYLVLGPTAIVVKMLRVELLDLNATSRPSYWRTRPVAPTSIDALRRQY